MANPLADDYEVVFESADPHRCYSYSPGILSLPSGRLVATLDLGGPGVEDLPGPKGVRYGNTVQGKVFTSDDSGATWSHRLDFPFMMARPFEFEGVLYLIGVAGDLKIMSSDDSGETWNGPFNLTDGTDWTQAPSNVWHANGCVYLVMNQRPAHDVQGWMVSVEMPVLMRGKPGVRLTSPDGWSFAESKMFRDIVAPDDLDYFGVPFYPSPSRVPYEVAPHRSSSPIGWLETNVVQFLDPDHYWYDPTGRTFHLWSRAHTGGTGYAAIAKVVETGDEPGTGSMITELESVPSGKNILYVPCPGGQMKFHVLYDDVDQLFWLLSTQATDSMRRADRLPPDRYNLPNNERRRLQLSFSRNMIDWCFAGMVTIGEVELASRHYASMVIHGSDLCVLSRSGDRNAENPHDTNKITFHTVSDFRTLVY